MENEKPLTIDPKQTADRIKSDGRTPASWARMRGVPRGTMNLIMSGKYPHVEDPFSRYQRVLRALRDDEYLVEMHEQEQAA